MRTQTATVWTVARPQTHHALLLLQRLQVLHQALVGHIERCLALARRQASSHAPPCGNKLVLTSGSDPLTAASLTSRMSTRMIPSSIREET